LHAEGALTFWGSRGGTPLRLMGKMPMLRYGPQNVNAPCADAHLLFPDAVLQCNAPWKH
jgi:hypothetical protein